jgi:hypothetical protein
MGYTLNRAIIKRIRCYDLGKEILKFTNFLIAFLNTTINYLRLE